MALDPRWPLALFRGSLPVALGLMLYVAIAGGEQERQQTLRVPGGREGAAGPPRGAEPPVTFRFFPARQAQPEGNPAALAERRRHNELIMLALREAAQTDDNVAQRPVPWRK